MRLESAGLTHVGLKRTHNEDSVLLAPEERLFCVADGMGGHSSGEVASSLAVAEVGQFFRLTSGDREMTWPFKMDKARSYAENRLATAIKLANARIFEAGLAERAYRGMGTTLVALCFEGDEAIVGHVGDSRVYRLHAAGGTLEQVTEDHSLLNDYIKARQLTAAEIESFPHKNVIVRALGMRESVAVDLARISPDDGDLFLLCSDGLSGMVCDARIAEILRAEPVLEAAAKALVDAANAAGGVDNVSCVLVRCRRD